MVLMIPAVSDSPVRLSDPDSALIWSSSRASPCTTTSSALSPAISSMTAWMRPNFGGSVSRKLSCAN